MSTAIAISLRHPAARVAALVLPLMLSACGHAEADPRTEPPLVRTALAGVAHDNEESFTGVVSSRVQSDLGFRIAGKVVARLVDTGQVVRRGRPLMRIDATDYVLAARQSQGSVSAARAAALQTAADERRYRDLVGAGAVSASAYDKVKADADAARAQLAAIEAQASVSRNEAGYAVLVADADGTVVETLAEPGQVVSAGQPVVRLAHAGAREAVVALPETQRPSIGSTAQASLFGGATATARLRQLSDAADPRTRTYEARFVLDGAAARAPLGSTITVNLGQARTSSGVEVPIGALYDRGRGPGIWTIDKSSRVRWRAVQVAAIGGETVRVSRGVRPGERFVSLGAHLLHDGEQVRVMGGMAAR
ncbi:efflux RND transporter periplasmic adaptor subunit [Novosphingobium sp. fls2-241-R2A-195]|jgi:RND family efflux transporter MFP subunit|uniref:efflux RND transporter periplasmic adaptor subunit n=1 Tax=Novosphingobium sp. fls2-241-R2A-195 TaxID=3040296 RepID=UPI00254B4F8E|nr:efflux RND transporter periplasmic adaptor subunit [Novosphingobium sp. fls2-241-R2A-195]